MAPKKMTSLKLVEKMARKKSPARPFDMVPARLPKQPVSLPASKPTVAVKYRPSPLRLESTVPAKILPADESADVIVEPVTSVRRSYHVPTDQGNDLGPMFFYIVDK
jgi:hypothetical protein